MPPHRLTLLRVFLLSQGSSYSTLYGSRVLWGAGRRRQSPSPFCPGSTCLVENFHHRGETGEGPCVPVCHGLRTPHTPTVTDRSRTSGRKTLRSTNLRHPRVWHTVGIRVFSQKVRKPDTQGPWCQPLVHTGS